MPISLVLDFHAADLRTRERLHPGGDHPARIYAAPPAGPVSELVLLTTCNRVELYGAGDACTPVAARGAAADLAARWAGDNARAAELLRLGTVRSGPEAVRHLLRVAAGLESQVLGDAQVLGQVRRSYRAAAAAGAAGPVLHRLFETALRTGKRVAAETSLTAARSTVGAEAATLAARRLGGLAGKRVVMVGCGKTGEQAARRLAKLEAGEVVLVNRTPGRAGELAREIGGRAAPWSDLHAEAARADAALVATAAGGAVLLAGPLAALRAADAPPLLLLDLSMPRNVEPEAGTLPGVALLDLDALRLPLAAAEHARHGAVPAAEAVVEEELARFLGWRSEAAARDAVEPLRAALEEICRRELSYAAGPDAAGRAAERIVAKVLARPMSALRTAAGRGDPLDAAAGVLRGLFGTGDGSAKVRSA